VEEEKENLRGCWEHIKKPCGLAGFTIQTRVRPQTDMAAQGWSMLLLAVLNLGIFGKLTGNFSFLSRYWENPEDISNRMRWFGPLIKL
jgi:hypothetical protein